MSEVSLLQRKDTHTRELHGVQVPRAARGWQSWLRLVMELGGLLSLAGLLFFDRLHLFQQYLSQYFDEDQGIEWYAARELLHGRLHEPCFYGQSYNSNVEGFLAAPLVAMRVPYPIAVPLVTVLLGLFPFVLMAVIAFRRRQAWVGGLSLLVPLSMSTRYGMITGMPRGFVTGVAMAIVPAMLLLPPLRRGMKGMVMGPDGRWRLQRTWPKTRYFLAAFLSVVALMLNPNAVVLLAAVAVYAIITTFKEWRFWFFGALGLLAATPYPIAVHDFYFVWHDDYRLYLRQPFTWSYQNFQKFIPQLNEAFHDLVPDAVYAETEVLVHWVHVQFPRVLPAWAVDAPAALAVLILFVVAWVVLLVRVRIAAAFATLTGVGLTIFAFAYDRLQNSKPSVSFPYARMFLAVPVLLVWLLLLLKRSGGGERDERLSLKSPGLYGVVRRWGPSMISGVVMAALVFAGYTVAMNKSRSMKDDIAEAVEHADVARPAKVTEAQSLAAAIQKIADAQHVSFVLVVGWDGRKWDYVLPELTTCETLFPDFERRTWRLEEECRPRYEKIIVLGNMPGPRGHPRQQPTTRISQNPPLAIYDLHGQSVDAFCRANLIHTRGFERPAPVPLHPPLHTPDSRP
jgi:hypothetical protein